MPPVLVQAAPDPVTVYDSIGAVPGNVASVGFEATSTSEFGDRVQVGPGSRQLSSVTVLMSSWACETGGWTGPTPCATTPGATFTHPLTLTLYADNGTASPGAVASAPIQPSRVLEMKVADLGGVVPTGGVTAVSLNVAATNMTTAGFVTVFPCGQLALVSRVNFATPYLSTANAVLVPVSAAGTVCFYSMAPVDLVVDINGWFAAP